MMMGVKWVHAELVDRHGAHDGIYGVPCFSPDEIANRLRAAVKEGCALECVPDRVMFRAMARLRYGAF